MNNPAGTVCGLPEGFSLFALASGSGLGAAGLDHLRPAAREQQRQRDLHLLVRPARHDDPVLDRRPAVRRLHLAGHLHPPRGGRPRVPGPGRSARRPDPAGADALRVGGHPRHRHDAARHHHHQGRAGPDGELHLNCSSSPASTTRPPRSRSTSSARSTAWTFDGCDVARRNRGPDRRRAHPRGARRRPGRQRRPDARRRTRGRRRHLRARHLHRARARSPRPRTPARPSSSSARTTSRDAGDRLRVLARQRRVRRPARRRTRSPAWLVGPHVFQVRAKDPAGVVDPTPDFYEWLITGAGRHHAA